MLGAHHATCGAAAWVALPSQVHVDLTLFADKAPFLPHAQELGMGLWSISPIGLVTGALLTVSAAMSYRSQPQRNELLRCDAGLGPTVGACS
ncbi:hypothetical protein GCM10007170_14130 [Arthrobacter liuii]|uniref:Uncharacterized protein n=2 Tax=Arthrobacter liuii TaxID=1476996 RepID=A0ABQ2ANM4_9MICC|nr:hypothetical protein GCM10007170_14130 [Arthrobacter liuii]